MTREEFLKIFPGLIERYRPAKEEVLKLENVDLLMIIGPSGVGKTTIIKAMDVPYVVADTTRYPREEEVDGVDYHFRADYEQIISEIQRGLFVNTAVGPNGDFYATRSAAYPVSGAAVYAIVADVIPYFRKLGFGKTIGAFIMPPSFEEWMRRMEDHHLSSDQLKGRLAEARRSLTFGLEDKDVNFILNDDVSKAVSQVKNLLDGKIDHKREDLARKAAQESLSRIS
ncbi:MAG TPA: hypothetical protein VG964_00875 [Candidatus Saccharimonadales bacterium]|nr:hypothetical protein [Candidatus Saccharimonadales bacterium]